MFDDQAGIERRHSTPVKEHRRAGQEPAGAFTVRCRGGGVRQITQRASEHVHCQMAVWRESVLPAQVGLGGVINASGRSSAARTARAVRARVDGVPRLCYN